MSSQAAEILIAPSTHASGGPARLGFIRAACPHDCPDTCAIRVTVQDGRAVKVQGDPDHPPTHGALCTKVSRYPERTYHPERLLTPLRRDGPKGSGRFVPVSWDEALNDIASRLQAIAARSPEAVLPYSYAGTMGLVQGEGMAGRFFNRLGASRLDRTICSTAGAEALAATYGGKIGMHLEFYAESRLILIWGSNPITSSVHFWTFAQAAKRAGAKLICIDPRRTETADKCHQHIALMPGTDGALALGIMQQLIVRDWLDHDYIAQHVEGGADGWPALRARALEWPPARVAATCGISAAEVEGLARDYGTTGPAAIRLNYGMQRVRGGGNATRLIAILPCLVGAWRHRAGGLLLSASGWFTDVRDDAALQRPDLRPAAGAPPRTLNMSTIGDDLLRDTSPGFGPKIEALIVYNSNPVAVAPESPKVVQGFSREDLFTVVLEQFQTDTADHADYLLPATTQLEHFDVHTSYGHTYVMVNEPAIAPLGQALPNAEIFRRLAARMGYLEPCFADDDEALGRAALRASRIDWQELRERGWVKLALPDAPFAHGGFPTPSGRCVIRSPAHGLPDHVENYESVASSPALAARYPLAMISPPARHFLNSSFVNLRSLRAIEGEPLVEIHPDDAAARGITSAQQVRIFNDRGSYLCKAEVSPPGAAWCRRRPRHLVAQARGRRQQRQPADPPAADRHRPGAELLRLPGRDRAVGGGASAAGRSGPRRPAGAVRRAGRRNGTGRQRVAVWALAAAVAGSMTGCGGTFGYYAQSVQGHLALTFAARPVADWLADPTTPPALHDRLVLSQQIRDFAVTELKEPDNASYRRYADLKRSAAVWNVVAAPELSLVLQTWCFPVVGCVGYRGYYDRADAQVYADGLKAQGLEVSVYGVPAYSTLGRLPGSWFADPLLNTFIDEPEGDLARAVFHELAHQIVYAPGDTEFNESFATSVERLGSDRWLRAHASAATREAFDRANARREDFNRLALRCRDALEAVYRSGADDREKRVQKDRVMADLRADYQRLKQTDRWAGYGGYDGWVARANNASFGVLAAYNGLTPGFERLFERSGQDFARYYAEVARIAALPKPERRVALP